ncbi:thioredoxin family protein [Cytobacillus suaedae]|nr:thioredoxin family protein [Cytobacillus suaedae]
MLNEWSEQEIKQQIQEENSFCLYLYTPMCGTCQVASKMLRVVQELLPDTTMGKCDLNYIPTKAKEWEIESVPCLLQFKDGKLTDTRIYAFRSVEHLYNTLK